MRGPSAFDHIHDEHDPAWHGHALVEPTPRWRSALRWPILMLLVAGIVVAALVAVPRDKDTAEPTVASAASDAAGGAVLPVVQPAAPARVAASDRSLPVVEGGAPQPTGDVMLSTASAPSETKRDIWAGAPWSYTSAASPTGSASSMVTGDTLGLAPGLHAALEQLATALGRPIDVVSGHRTRAEQADLYRRFTSGTGNLAAVPGTSRHEHGDAADVYVGGVALADVPGAALLAQLGGLGFPVPGEPWHVEAVSRS